jgi:hypothetical protein
MALYSGPGQIPTFKGVPTNKITLPSGGTYPISPAGYWMIRTGLYSCIQQYDPITGTWVRIGGGVTAGGVEYIYSDGVNYRIANQTGAAVGALLTTAGSGYTSAPIVTASAGGSLWKTWIGGAVNTTVSVVSGGSGYTYPPIVFFSAPPPITSGGGIQATGYATISGGVVTAITVTNQGAGYPSAPMITLFNDPRETPNIAIAGSGVTANTVTQGTGAAAVCTLTGAGTVTGIVCLDHGQGGLTSVPTLAFSSGSAAATAIMNWTVTAATVGTGGATVVGAFVNATAEDNFPATASAYTNPDTQSKLVAIRKADVRYTVSAGSIATPVVIYDGGIYTSQPTTMVVGNVSAVTTPPVATFTMGGVTDISYGQQL